VCDPLDFELHAEVAERYGRPLAAGEALFSEAEARLLHLHGGLKCGRDFLVFDPVHCYGVPGFVRIVSRMRNDGWPSESFWPHGGHLFAHHVVAAMELGGAECNPLSFLPFSGLPDDVTVKEGSMTLSRRPGIGFEGVPHLNAMFRALG
jgi:L-alanine-DL-glutamate epimerase-like enolase superfamily enzyme